MQDVVIAGYLRSAQSRSRPRDPGRDWLHKIRADELLATLLPELLKRAGVDPEEVDDFIVGSAMGVSENWAYGASGDRLTLSSQNGAEVGKNSIRIATVANIMRPIKGWSVGFKNSDEG